MITRLFSTVVAGLAAQEALGSVVSGVMILLFKPFKMGDVVRYVDSDITGTVEEITLHHTAVRLLRRKTGYHSDNTAGRQQGMYRARKQRYRSDNDHAAGKIHRRDRDIAHKAGYCRERTARLSLSVDELAHQSIYRLRRDIGQHCGQDRQSGHAQKATGGRGEEFFYLCKQAQHSFP